MSATWAAYQAANRRAKVEYATLPTAEPDVLIDAAIDRAADQGPFTLAAIRGRLRGLPSGYPSPTQTARHVNRLLQTGVLRVIGHQGKRAVYVLEEGA